MTTTFVLARRKLRVRCLPPFACQPLDLRLSRSRFEATCGRLQAAERVLQEGEPYVLKRGDRVLQAEWIVETAWLKIQQGDLSAASRCLDRLATVAPQGDVGRRADLHWLRGHLARAGGESDASQREFARAGRIWQERAAGTRAAFFQLRWTRSVRLSDRAAIFVMSRRSLL